MNTPRRPRPDSVDRSPGRAPDESRRGLSRRGFLGVTAGVGLAVAAGSGLARASARPPAPSSDWPIAEPYPVVHGGRFTGPPVPQSWDPLVRYHWDTVAAGDDLQVYQLRPVAVTTDAPGSFTGLASATTHDCDVLVSGSGSIRFDFGVESPAWLEFDSPDFSDSSAAVTMSISEYNDLAQVNPGPAHPVKTLAPQRYGNTFRLELNAELFEGVRFGWIHVTAFEQPFHITAVRVVSQAKPADYQGSFACSDEEITRIWYAGAYGVRVGFQADYMAPILMDRGDRFGWAGDCNAIQAAALVAFGDWDYVKHNLDRTVDSTFGIETYSLYWVLSLLEYYRHTGDADTVRSYSANVQGKLDHGNDIYADPSILFYGWDERLGAGFEAGNRLETKTGYRMLLIRACREFADALDSIGDNDGAARYRALAEQRTAELRADPDWYAPLGVHALAEAVNAGCVTPDEQPTIIAREFADRLNRLSFSTFNQYYILQAMSAMNRVDDALVTVRDNWGGQLRYGSTTYFEVFRPDWLDFLGPNDPIPNSQSGWTSLSHPWGGGVSAWLTRDVLGISPTAPGFAGVDIVPRLGASSLSWVAGSVPTPRGPVSARFDLGSGHCSVVIPDGSVAHVGLPHAGRTITRIRLDGHLVWDGGFHPAPGVDGATDDGEHVLLNGVPAGRHELSVRYAGRRPPFTPAPISHPMRFVRLDDRTGGDWGGRYGADGHVLFNYDGAGRNRASLPAYVSSVQPWTQGYAGYSNCLNAIWEPATSDRRALAPDAGNGSSRTAACLYSSTPSPAGMTMVVELAAERSVQYQLAMYFVDWDAKGRRIAVEVFDLDSRKLVAPERLVDDFVGGAYLVYAVEGPLRLRIAHVRGDNAVLSGLFFDPIS